MHELQERIVRHIRFGDHTFGHKVIRGMRPVGSVVVIGNDRAHAPKDSAEDHQVKDHADQTVHFAGARVTVKKTEYLFAENVPNDRKNDNEHDPHRRFVNIQGDLIGEGFAQRFAVVRHFCHERGKEIAHVRDFILNRLFEGHVVHVKFAVLAFQNHGIQEFSEPIAGRKCVSKRFHQNGCRAGIGHVAVLFTF